jgi:hypothetical protein
MKKLIVFNVKTKKNRIKKIEKNFVETLIKMINEITLTLKHLQKKITK